MSTKHKLAELKKKFKEAEKEWRAADRTANKARDLEGTLCVKLARLEDMLSDLESQLLMEEQS
jgi:hypothetical protein